MENLDELHLEVKKRSNTNNTDIVTKHFWTILAEQPLHIQFRLIKQGLDRHKPFKVCKHEGCSFDKCSKTLSIQPPPESHAEHPTPPKPPKRIQWLNRLFGSFLS